MATSAGFRADRSAASRYLIAAALTGAVIVLRLPLQPWLGFSVPYLQFFPAILAAASIGGFGPGVLATAFAAILANYFFMDPPFSFAIRSIADAISLPMFILVGVMISWVTESLRLAARRLENANASATAASRRLHEVVANVPGIVWEAWGQPDAANQRIDFVSDHVHTMLGYRPEEWTAVPNFWLSIVHPDDKARAAAEARAIFESRANGHSAFRWVARDGRIVWVEAHSSVILDDSGAAVGMRGVTLDISQRRQLEAEREDLLVRAERARSDAVAANRLKDDFLATLSHELRTPLNAILGYARMLKQGIVDRERQARAFEIVERNASALSVMVADVLDVSRIITGKIRLDVRAVDLPSVVEAAVATVRPAAEAKSIQLQTVLDPKASPISGDPDRIQQIAWNLLSNAVRFTPRGGRIQVRVERIASQVQIVVSDTGSGIASDFLPHVFERFRQADSRFSREHGGLGLGLAITKELTELHGGTIRALSEGPGRGATFIVEFPLMIMRRASDAGDDRAHPQADVAAPPLVAGALAGVEVLVVDDDRDALTMMQDVLEAAGAKVLVSGGGEDALSLLRGTTPHAIVTDIGMPKMDGFELLRALRQLP